MPGKFVIVDGNSLLYRAFFALPNLTTSDGRPTGALYGLSTMLLRLLKEEKPDYGAVVFDAPGPTFRHEAFADYKATRPETPEELRAQSASARDLCAALGFRLYEVPGVEADDVVGTLARRAEATGLEVLIVTGDLDALQLVSDRVQVLTNRRGLSETVRYDRAAVKERYGIEPWQIPHLKALAGDPSDNIPGVPGIGEKTASKLLQRYGTIEAILAHREEIGDKRLRATLQEAGDQPRRSRELATLNTDVPLDFDLEACRWCEVDRKRLRDFFEEFEFRSLRREFEEEVPTANTEVRLLVSRNDLEALWQEAREGRGLALALGAKEAAAHPEEEGLTKQEAKNGPQLPLDGMIQSASSSPDSAPDRSAEVFPISRPRLERLGLCAGGVPYVWEAGEGAVTVAMLRPLLEDPDLPKCAHDLKALWIACRGAGITLAGGTFDTMVADYLLNPARASHALEEVALHHLGYEVPSAPENTALAAKVAATFSLWEVLHQRLCEEQLEELNRDLEVPLIRILAEMELHGVAVDVAHLQRLSARMQEEAERLEREIYELAGTRFNIGSTKQLQAILFEKLGLPPEKKTKTGYSTGVEVLQMLSQRHPLPGKILAYRELTKLKSTYADALPRLVDPQTGRLHTSLNQTVTATGRLSSSTPNLQNIPVRTEIGREIRRAFVAPEGKVLLSADYSQIELRLLAHVSGDAELRRAFAADEDIHVTTASALFGVSESEVTADMRRRAKTVNFAVIYGMSEFGLSRDLGVPVETARAWIENYFRRYPRVLEWKKAIIEQAQRDGYVTTLMNRRRYLPEIRSRNRNFQEAAQRAAVNTPIQGTAADIIKKAMIRVDECLRTEGFQGKMVLQVHDELLFEVPPEEEAPLAERVRSLMSTAFPLDVPLKVDVKVGPNWADMEAVRLG